MYTFNEHLLAVDLIATFYSATQNICICTVDTFNKVHFVTRPQDWNSFSEEFSPDLKKSPNQVTKSRPNDEFIDII